MGYGATVIYLACTGAPLDPDAEGPWDEVFPVADGVAFVRSDLHRSAVYHGLKDALPRGASLLVTELHEVPKMKGVAPGSLAWARRELA